MLYKVKWKKVSFSMVWCCHIEFLVTFLATYSRVPNKPTGHLLDNEKKNPPILFSIKKLKSPTHISFFSPKLKKKVPIHIFIWNHTSIRNSKVLLYV